MSNRPGVGWPICGRCLRHHTPGDLAPCEAVYRGAKRTVRICTDCRGRKDHEVWLTRVVGRARYIADQRAKEGNRLGVTVEGAIVAVKATTTKGARRKRSEGERQPDSQNA